MGQEQSKAARPTTRKATQPAASPSPSAPPNQNRKPSRTDRVNRKVDGALAWPGRDDVDPRAPYSFGKCADPAVESAMDGIQYDIFGAALQYRDDGKKDVINFYHIENGREQTMPRLSTFERCAWVVGVAFNPWRVVDGFSSGVQQQFAHWGVYIRPLAVDKQGPNYQIFGMNFRKEYKGQLILENAWGTPGEQGTGVWKKALTHEDFRRVQEKGLEEVVMYFSFEEFVLNLQLVLWDFVRRRKHSSQGEIDQHRGDAYSLFRGNCQHFARNVMAALKERGWMQKNRLHSRFILNDLETELLEKLFREIRDARPGELDYYMQRMNLQLLTPERLNRTATWMRKYGTAARMQPDADKRPGK
ncbi:hypothetical protein BJX68DRAFT_265414 [Aspergillus pseudodeflectus]|uniref:PPPDE domain-containing protein n=1 Tax=Aspergillus pseudodeflectus TaxID=176178 RepID=A0ABR4KLN9_9EURO